MYEVNEDAIGINCLSMWVCLFLGNLYRIEQRGAYVRLRDWERVMMMMREREREGKGCMLDSLAKAQYPEKTNESVCCGKVSESRPLEIFSPRCLVSTAILR